MASYIVDMVLKNQELFGTTKIQEEFLWQQQYK